MYDSTAFDLEYHVNKMNQNVKVERGGIFWTVLGKLVAWYRICWRMTLKEIVLRILSTG